MLPRPQLGKDRRVAAFDRESARSKDIGDLSLVNEHRRLRFAHNQLRAVLDFLIAYRKPVHHRVSGVVEPFNDFDELCARAEPVKNSHLLSPLVRPLPTARYYTVKRASVFKTC